MNRFLIVILLLISIPAHSFTNEPDGFRGIKWGDDFEQYKEQMVLLEHNDETSIYSRNDDKLILGAANLEKISYVFKNNKFNGVLIRTNTYTDDEALISVFKEKFGSGSQPNRYIKRYFWNGNVSKITISCKSIKDECIALITSTKALNEEKQSINELTKNGVNDF